MNQTRKDKENNTDRQDPKKLPATEVFDSSRYSAMNDMTKGASGHSIDEQVMVDVQKKEPLNPRKIMNEAITEDAPKPSDAKINPMTIEERARTIREIHGETLSDTGRENEQEIKAIEHESRGYNTIPDWTEAMMRQYVEMATAGIELYNQFLKNSTDIARLWFKAWLPRTED
jgi:hypothetical protein